MLGAMRTKQPNLMSPRPKNERRLAQDIPSEADKIKSRLARIAAMRRDGAEGKAAGVRDEPASSSSVDREAASGPVVSSAR
jgi:hypothetical protein